MPLSSPEKTLITSPSSSPRHMRIPSYSPMFGGVSCLRKPFLRRTPLDFFPPLHENIVTPLPRITRVIPRYPPSIRPMVRSLPP